MFSVNVDEAESVINSAIDSNFELKESIGLEESYEFENDNGLGVISTYKSEIMHWSYFKKMEERKALVETLAESTAKSFGGKVEVKHTKQYLNMKDGFKNRPDVIENLVRAYKNAGVEPELVPIRGGTDGSRLTEMGIPTPNIFTGGHNFHSRTEWASLEQMEKAVEVLVNLIKDR